MSIFNFDNKDNRKKKDFTPLQRLGIALYYQSHENRESCQLCGNEAKSSENLSQLWMDDLPLAKTCSDCIAMIDTCN